MIGKSAVETSRRQFLVAGGMTVAATYLAPGNLFAQDDNLVIHAFHEAARAKITVQPLRRNISALLGAGGNIAVLTGADGKLLIDAEIVTARPQVVEALENINADPVKQLINTHWPFDHTVATIGCTRPEPAFSRRRTPASTFAKTPASSWFGNTHFRPRPREPSPRPFSRKITPCTPMIPL